MDFDALFQHVEEGNPSLNKGFGGKIKAEQRTQAKPSYSDLFTAQPGL